MKDISQEEVQYVRRRDQKPRKNVHRDHKSIRSSTIANIVENNTLRKEKLVQHGERHVRNVESQTTLKLNVNPEDRLRVLTSRNQDKSTGEPYTISNIHHR